ncbi:uncharacterized protein LOC142983713 [Anticarsia gemmatalis]|uniref:uncharacterized protein LOC142983713 n=1 Tax=Anticarsia gemmatalis TaxID=129554 RepID=UPI003F776D35
MANNRPITEVRSVEIGAEVFFFGWKTRYEIEFFKRNVYDSMGSLNDHVRVCYKFGNFCGLALEQTPLKNQVLEDGTVVERPETNRQVFKPTIPGTGREKSSCCLMKMFVSNILMPYFWVTVLFDTVVATLGYAFYQSIFDIHKYHAFVGKCKSYCKSLLHIDVCRVSFFYNCGCPQTEKQLPKFNERLVILDGTVTKKLSRREPAPPPVHTPTEYSSISHFAPSSRRRTRTGRNNRSPGESPHKKYSNNFQHRGDTYPQMRKPFQCVHTHVSRLRRTVSQSMRELYVPH